MSNIFWRSKSARSGQGGLKLLLGFVSLVLLLTGTLPIAAQQITGSFKGTVKDEQGAVIPNATVKATNADTGFSRSTVTDGDGVYNIQYLPVGKYTVQADASGFKRYLQENLIITVDQTQALNITLAIGAESQTITVTETPVLVNTTTAELGRTIQPAEILGLPLVNRNAYAELSLTPGVQSNSASAQSNPSGTPNFVVGLPSTQVQVNGSIDGGVPMVAYYLDGGINMTGLRNYGNQVPNPDALQEFRVETNNFSAQYGRMSGAVVTAVTRSGTNRWHGSLFEFNRNTDLNAYPWNAPINPLTHKALNAPYHRNQFGGTVGGPVVHDKAFFFFSYAGLRQVVGQLLSGAIVPTANVSRRICSIRRLEPLWRATFHCPTRPQTDTSASSPVQRTRTNISVSTIKSSVKRITLRLATSTCTRCRTPSATRPLAARSHTRPTSPSERSKS
jgi:hypothetical protein